MGLNHCAAFFCCSWIAMAAPPVPVGVQARRTRPDEAARVACPVPNGHRGDDWPIAHAPPQISERARGHALHMQRRPRRSDRPNPRRPYPCCCPPRRHWCLLLRLPRHDAQIRRSLSASPTGTMNRDPHQMISNDDARALHQAPFLHLPRTSRLPWSQLDRACLFAAHAPDLRVNWTLAGHAQVHGHGKG